MIKINKAQWKMYKFGKIVSNISERAEPKETNLDIYVGLEHLDPDCIHIKRKGHPSDVKGTKLRVYPGDVIFGKRRAYQRKAAVVDFDGICSAHAMVVRANPDTILPELLPYFMHSDVFMYRAVDVSEGSLSPTIKWKILAEQQFKLPPIDEQRLIAELFWSINKTIERWNDVLIHTETLMQSHFKEKVESYPVSAIKVEGVLEKTCEFKVGKIPQSEYLDNGKYPIIDQSKADVAGYSDREELVYSGELPALVFGDHTTEVKYIELPFILGADGTKVVCPKPIIKARYLFYAIRSLNLKPDGYRRHFAILKDSKIKVPDINEQVECVKELDSFFNKKTQLNSHIIVLKNILKATINQIFG